MPPIQTSSTSSLNRSLRRSRSERRSAERSSLRPGPTKSQAIRRSGSCWNATRTSTSGRSPRSLMGIRIASSGHSASKRAEVRAVEQGNEDVAFDGAPRRLVHEVTTRYARQAHPHPNWEVTYLFLNTKVPPFDDVRARRAVSFAADRIAAGRSAAQELGAKPTCQILPPSFPGFRRYCPYTLHAGPKRMWNVADLKQARQLIAASGTKGTPVTIWVPENQQAEGPFAATLLQSLGYPTRLKQVSAGVYYDAAKGPGNPRHRVQDFPSPGKPTTPPVKLHQHSSLVRRRCEGRQLLPLLRRQHRRSHPPRARTANN